MKKLSMLVAALVVLAATTTATVSAVDYGGVGGRPANPVAGNPRTQSIFIYTLKPGQSANDAVRIYNNTSTTRTIAVGAVDSVLASGGAFSCAQAADLKTDVGAWLTLSTADVTVPANGSQVVPFTVTVPASAGVGEHDGCVTIQDMSMTETSKEQSGVVLGFRSAIRVVVTIPGAIIKKLNLAAVTVDELQNGNYLVTPAAKNTGNVSLDTTITVRLASAVGPVVGRKEGTYPVLPHSQATWNFELPRPFWGGWYHAVATVTYNSNPTAGIGDTQGNAKTEQLSSAIFFALPTPMGGFTELLFVLAVAGAAAWLYRKRRDARHVRTHWEIFTIEEGDTISSLAADYHTAWRKIARVNGLKPPYGLRAGQRLRLPPRTDDRPMVPKRLAKMRK